MELTATQIEALTAAGGSRWTKGPHDRIYFNVATLPGVEIRNPARKGGYLTLDGETFSNRCDTSIRTLNCWVDVTTGELHTESNGDRKVAAEVATLIDRFEGLVAGLLAVDEITATPESGDEAEDEDEGYTLDDAQADAAQHAQHTGAKLTLADIDIADVDQVNRWFEVLADPAVWRIVRSPGHPRRGIPDGVIIHTALALEGDLAGHTVEASVIVRPGMTVFDFDLDAEGLDWVADVAAHTNAELARRAGR